MYIWKINMKSGHFFIVKGLKNDYKKFIEDILIKTETINIFDLVEPKMYELDRNTYEMDAVAISSKDVSSIEFISSNCMNDKKY